MFWTIPALVAEWVKACYCICLVSIWNANIEQRTKIKWKRPVCDAKSVKRKSFPLSLPWSLVLIYNNVSNSSRHSLESPIPTHSGWWQTKFTPHLVPPPSGRQPGYMCQPAVKSHWRYYTSMNPSNQDRVLTKEMCDYWIPPKWHF